MILALILKLKKKKMISHPFIVVFCDNCQKQIQMECPDDRSEIIQMIESRGWVTKDAGEFCCKGCYKDYTHGFSYDNELNQ
jgi:hypothetical protein